MKSPKEFIQEWIETVCSNDASKIANLYQEDAILLGTFCLLYTSPSPRD